MSLIKWACGYRSVFIGVRVCGIYRFVLVRDVASVINIGLYYRLAKGGRTTWQ